MIRALIAGCRGAVARFLKPDARTARPAVEPLETREVMSGYTVPVMKYLDAILAVKVVPQILSNYAVYQAAHGTDAANASLLSTITPANIASLLNANGLGTLAATPNATRLLAYDLVLDMAFILKNPKTSMIGAPPAQLSNPSVELAVAASLSKLAGATLGGNAALASNAISGVSVANLLASARANGVHLPVIPGVTA